MNRAEKRRQKKLAKKQRAPSALALPPSLQSSLDLALQHHAQGRLSDAKTIYQQILQFDPKNSIALHFLGVVAHQTGRDDIAADLISKALAVSPKYTEALNNLGTVLTGLGRLDEAASSYRKALAIDARDAETHYNLANTYKALGRSDEAVTSYNKAIAIRPGYAEAHNNMGNVLKTMGRLDDAVASFSKAIDIKPNYAEAHNNLASTYRNQKKSEEAIASFQKAIDIDPDYAEAHYNLGNTYRVLGRFEEAIASYHKALAINPELVEAYNNLGNILTDLGQLDEATECYRQALAINPNHAMTLSNLIYSHNFTPSHTAASFLEEARRYGELVTAQARPIDDHRNVPDPNKKLRVGLVSGDFRQHSVSYFLDAILHEIDPEKLELYAYSNFPSDDDMTDKIRSNVSAFKKVSTLSDEKLAEDIVADGIDVLVDLSGHTAFNRLSLFAWKPAPVQVTWLGYSGTTGVEAIDYILCDPTVIPKGDEPYFAEKPWRLPDIWLCFSPPDMDIDVDALPSLENGYVTFGSFNNLSKVSDQTIACWAQILLSVPKSRLLLKSKQLTDATAQDNIIAAFEAHGVDRERLILLGQTPSKADHFRTYNTVDIALDPFPYAGTTTSVEALWMGTPLITLKGNSFISHTGESILRNVGLEDWIGETQSDYIEKAVAFAADLPALSDLSRGLRERLLVSPACDAPRFARNLEDAFRDMWREWCG